LPENLNLYNNDLNNPVMIGDNTYTYGVCLLNKKCGFENVLINKQITKKQSDEISKLIYESTNYETKRYYNQLKLLDNFLFYFITVTKHCPSINVSEMADLVNPQIKGLFKKLPRNHVQLGYHINEALVDRCINDFNKNYQLYKLFKSGSRFSKTQLARSCINIGYTADAQNIIAPNPITGNLLTGISEEEFFSGAPGTRKSIRDKSKWTPDSGYLERTLVMALSMLEIVEEDCGGTNFLEFIVFNKQHAESLIGKYYKDPHSPYDDWEILDQETAIQFINRKIFIRSPMTCTTENFKMCQKCFGERRFPTKYLGIVCGQTISERLTQLVLRTFHTSGAAELTMNSIVKDLLRDHLINIQNLDNGDIRLFLDTPQVEKLTTKINGFKDVQYEGDLSIVTFSSIFEDIPNNDTISMLRNIQQLLKSSKSPQLQPIDYYNKLMELVLTVGTPYSSFVEMVFANMFMTDPKTKEFWRYNAHKKIKLKLGDKTLAKNLSPLLGLLYQPNKNTIQEINILEDIDLDNTDMTIYEKIFLSRL
jgi:hypothetical protein